MSNPEPRRLGLRDGLRYAITWLHRRAEQMNDHHARAVLNSAAFYLGNEIREGHTPPIPDGAPPSPQGDRHERAVRNLSLIASGEYTAAAMVALAQAALDSAAPETPADTASDKPEDSERGLRRDG